MDALRASSSFPSYNLHNFTTITTTFLRKQPALHIPLTHQHKSILPPRQTRFKNTKFKLLTAITTSNVFTNEPKESTEQEAVEEEKFDWYSQWYPIMPECDLDKRKPHGTKVMGIDIVVWWDKNDQQWKVFDDACPHRLAPLSEGRIDQWGRLQCVYHGWCFGGSGDCKFIPQAPRDGPPVHTSKRACVAAYPSCLQNGIIWFWPNTDPHFKNIFLKQKPPYIPEIDDPSYYNKFFCRDIPYGYEVLIENLMDPSHVAYAHTGIMKLVETSKSMKADREGGRPLDITLNKLDINGFTAMQPNDSNIFITTQERGAHNFIPPCLYYFTSGGISTSVGSTQDVAQKELRLVFFCIPVSPGKSRLILTLPKNVGAWIDQVIPNWMFHIQQHLIIDSDLHLLHMEERKLKEISPFNWNKSCFVPTKSDANIVAFRRWLNKYGGGQVDFGTKCSGALPPTPPREVLFDRYWSHTVNCKSCILAYKSLNMLKTVLQVFTIASIGIVAVTKQSRSVIMSVVLMVVPVLCFMGSKWLSHFIYKTFHYHDYDHAFH